MTAEAGQWTWTGLDWAPLVPLSLWWSLLAASLALGGLLLWRRATGSLWRLLPLAALLLVLANPQSLHQARTALPMVVVVAVDDSSSQSLGERRQQTSRALASLKQSLAGLSSPPPEIREVHVGDAPPPPLGEGGTRLYGALEATVADIPPSRLAGILVLSDGQIHDLPPVNAGGNKGGEAKSPFPAPLHLLLTGQRGETDRRLLVDSAPAFGLVGSTVSVRLRVEDPSMARGETARLTITGDDGQQRQVMVSSGQAVTVPVAITHGGSTVLAAAVDARPGEPSLANNQVAVTLSGIRDRLRVLLVSGEPHVGERVWRSLLKSDPNVDLVHFTILRPPSRDDSTPLSELALIPFPMRELFEEKLKDFDLVLFDRYAVQGLVPVSYLQNIARYVRDGGALLLAVGPEYAGPGSLFDSPLADVLPAAPASPTESGRSWNDRAMPEQEAPPHPFVPRLSDAGHRHPITAGLLPADGNGNPAWGPWLRLIQAAPRHGTILLEADHGEPLLMVDRVGKGRVGLLLSDTVWLWARGWQGGGPQGELFRRLAHWLMGEPDLEENALTARAITDSSGKNQLLVERRSLEATPPPPVTVTDPDGQQQSLTLGAAEDGRASGSLPAPHAGIWKVSDGQRSALVAVGNGDQLELRDVVATADKMAPLVRASGGGVFWLQDDLPSLRMIDPAGGATRSGSGWAGLQKTDSYLVTGSTRDGLIPPSLAFAFIFLALMLAWWQEGRSGSPGES